MGRAFSMLGSMSGRCARQLKRISCWRKLRLRPSSLKRRRLLYKATKLGAGDGATIPELSSEKAHEWCVNRRFRARGRSAIAMPTAWGTLRDEDQNEDVRKL